jgi:hypothetical protein
MFSAATQAWVSVGTNKVTLLPVKRNNIYEPRGHLEFFIAFIPRALLAASPLDVTVASVYFKLSPGKAAPPYQPANAQVNIDPIVLDVKANFRVHWYQLNVSDAGHELLHPGIFGIQHCLHTDTAVVLFL